MSPDPHPDLPTAGAPASAPAGARPVPARRVGAVLTIGHSTRPLEEFIRILRSHGVARLVDVRAVQRSRRNPQFDAATLPAALARTGIAHASMPGLGGLRQPRPDSINRAWRNASLRGYADHMQTPEFEAELGRLVELAEGARIAIMCAEAVPWRCHRSLIADALLARGVPVAHILGGARAEPHRLTPFARIAGTRVTYPASDVFTAGGEGGSESP